MKTLYLLIVLALCARAEADDLFLQMLSAKYDFATWPTGTYPNLVTNWNPCIDWSLPSDYSVSTNECPDYAYYSVCHSGTQVADIRVELFETANESKTAMLRFFANCQTTNIFTSGTNSWNTIGTKNYAADDTSTPSFLIFYRNNVLVTLFSSDPNILILSLAKMIDDHIQDCSTNAVPAL